MLSQNIDALIKSLILDAEAEGMRCEFLLDECESLVFKDAHVNNQAVLAERFAHQLIYPVVHCTQR